MGLGLLGQNLTLSLGLGLLGLGMELVLLLVSCRPRDPLARSYESALMTSVALVCRSLLSLCRARRTRHTLLLPAQNRVLSLQES